MKPESDTFTKLFEKARLIQDSILDWQSRRPPEIQAGELFYLTMPLPFPVTWCAAFQHPRDPALWFCVPGDSFSIVTAADVEAPASEFCEALNFRCNCGLWVHHDDIDLKTRFDEVLPAVHRQIKATVSALAKDPLALLADDNNAEDPDYLEWISELRMAVDALTHLLHDDYESSVRLIGPEWSVGKSAASLSLAAAPGEEPTVEPNSDLLDTRQLPHYGHGSLLASLYIDGIVIEWRSDDEEVPPPTIVYDGQPINWLGGDGLFFSATIPWLDNEVKIKLGPEVVILVRE